MVFSSLVFLVRFLPVTALLYFLAPNNKIKNLVLIAASLFFYAWGEPVWVILLILSSIIDFICGGMAGKYQNTRKGKMFLVTSLVLNLGMLALFKYGNFFVDNLNAILNLQVPNPRISLPIGISFYTMQTITYTIDAYRGKVKVQKSFANFLLFVSMFPQLVAGPIVRYEDIETQLAGRKVSMEDMYIGVNRFIRGLAKKTLIANYAGFLAAKFLDGDLLGQSSPLVWFGLLCYTFQIYFDFSGYSDMAIGLGRMFGFRFPENFNHPYVSQSITEFWRRWHMTLGRFFRDYVYIPMGGNRRLQYRNILVVWMLTGFWHGASWNFIIWGLYFAGILILEKTFLLKVLGKVPKGVRIAYSFFLVMFGFNFFYFVDFNRNINALKVMFGLAGTAFTLSDTVQLLINYLPFIAVCVTGAMPAREFVMEKLKKLNLPSGVVLAGATVCTAAVLIFCTASIVSNSYNPFIYFRF